MHVQEEAAAKRLLMEEHRTEEERLQKNHQDTLRSMEKAYEVSHDLKATIRTGTKSGLPLI